MPVYRERLWICPDASGQPIWIAEFPLWWDRRAFFDQFGSRQFDTGNPIDMNYALLLTKGEAAGWDRRCRAAFAGDPRAALSVVVDDMRSLDERLYSAAWVIVESYEWESGL